MSGGLTHYLASRGSVLPIEQLVAAGHSRREISRELRGGAIVRICNGWVASPSAERDAIAALAAGGKLTSSSALNSRGIWDGCDNRVHVAVPPNSPRRGRVLRVPLSTFRPPQHPRSGLVRHWIPERATDNDEPPWRVSVIDSLACASKHLSDEQFVACVDSAIRQNALSRAGLPQLGSLLSRHSRSQLNLIDPRAESGLESLARVCLRRIVRDVQVQASIPGIAATGGPGRVDLLLNGWLAVELDGDEWHDMARDHRRDAILVRQGFRCHRFGFRQVVTEWADSEATVRELLRYPPQMRRM